MGLVMLGFASLTKEGLLGAVLQMFSHGVMTALFFAVVGLVYDRAHTREIGRLGGFASKMPLAALAFIIGGLTSMGLPGLSGFIAEFPIFLGVWQVQPIAAALAAIAIVVTAGYILLVVRRVFFGKVPEEFVSLPGGIRLTDTVALLLLMAVLVGLGLFPDLMAPMIQKGVDSVMSILHTVTS